METNHTITKLEDELKSILFETFEQHGWKINELPTIFDSDQKPNNLSSNPDLLDIENFLGIYRLKEKCSIGEVVLYRENIKDLSNRYFYELEMRGKKIDGKPIFVFLTTDDYLIRASDIFEYLNSIVLIHELTHWMIHWNIDFNKKSLKCDDKYESDDEIDFHEGLAQYFTDSVIRKYGNKKIIDLFESLNSKQSKPYQVFEELKTDLDGKTIEISSVFTALAICWFNKYEQSFELLKKHNYLSVLYYPNDYITSFNAIKELKPALNQKKIIKWYEIKPFDNDHFLVDYFTEDNKKYKRGTIAGRKYGLQN